MTVPQPYNSEGLNNAYGFPVPYTRLFPAPVIAARIPSSSTDLRYPVGQIWIYPAGGVAYILVANSGGTADWQPFVSSSGDLFTLTADSGGAVPPDGSGNITLNGTTSQITTTGTPLSNKIVFSIPTTFVAPGSIASTTTITAATGLTVTAGGAAITGTTTINITGAAVTTIGTGGTGAVHIGNATGNTAVTGTLTSSGQILATTGSIGTNNGNIVAGTAGNKIFIAAGSNASVGLSGAMTGSPGAIIVPTTASSATALIFFSRAVAGGTLGNVTISAQDGTGFTLTSDGNETSKFNWWIINA